MELRKFYKTIKFVASRNKLLKDLAFKYCLLSNNLPKVLTIALTYECQCQCIHCGVSDYQKNDVELSKEEIKEILDEAAADQSIVQITFTGGEPLLRNELCELIQYAKKYHFFTKIDSNAFLMDKDQITKLKYAGLDRVGISLDHHREKEHDNLRKCPGIFKNVLNAIIICHELNLSVYLQTYVTKQNLHNGDLAKILTLGKELGVEKIKIQAPAIICSFKDNKAAVLDYNDFLLLEKIIRTSRIAFLESEIFSPLDYVDFCRVNFKTNIHITSYGEVLPCCFVPLSFGNIRDNSLAAIMKIMYSSQVFKNISNKKGCLCSNLEFLHEFISDPKNIPIRIV